MNDLPPVFHSPKLNRPVLLAVALLALVGLLASLSRPAPAAAVVQADTTLTCSPNPATGKMGRPVAVDIVVNDIVDLYGLDVAASFDPTMLQIVDADPLAPGIQVQPLFGFMNPGFVNSPNGDNSAGTIRFFATQLYPALPVSGSGALFRVTFDPQQVGTSTLSFDSFQFATRDGVLILPVSAVDCVIIIDEADPEPTLMTTFMPAVFAQ